MADLSEEQQLEFLDLLKELMVAFCEAKGLDDADDGLAVAAIAMRYAAATIMAAGVPGKDVLEELRWWMKMVDAPDPTSLN